jgi:hypothetical protein
MSSATFDREYLVDDFKHAGRTVKIFRDPDPMSPREYDNWATLACWHRRRNLGDKRIDGMDLDTLRETVTAEGDEILAVLAIYAYEHGDITLRTGDANPFTDRFDSGQVGWGYVTRSNAEKMMGAEPIPSTEELTRYVQQEVTAYDNYLTGQIYGYEVEGRAGDDLESCWGIDDLEYCRSEAKTAAENSDDPADDRDAAELAERPTFAGPVSP